MVRCHVGRRGRIGAEAIAGITAGLSFARPSGRAFFGESAGGRGRLERAMERGALVSAASYGWRRTFSCAYGKGTNWRHLARWLRKAACWRWWTCGKPIHAVKRSAALRMVTAALA